jgi:predicted GTPase
MVKNVIIMGAAGRDFHNFLTCYKDNAKYNVIAFTAAQIPSIAKRTFPQELAGRLYPQGIPIFPEEQLPQLIREHGVDTVAFSYSDLPHTEVMHKAAITSSLGADFLLIGNRQTMLSSKKPVVSVCGVRTGCGKSQTTRKVCQIFKNLEKKIVVVRHPMPYGDLSKQVVQRFAVQEDFARHQCTIEEMEEYEPLVAQGIVVYAGVDYGKILKRAETEADIVIWDGGNNDTPFFRPDIHIVVFDSLRPGHELLYYPGETNMRMADIAIINKINSAQQGAVQHVTDNIQQYAPDASLVLAESKLLVKNPERIKGKRVLVVEDGPTLTHGEMRYGAGYLAARKYGAAKIIDPRPFAVRSIKDTFDQYPHIKKVLPAMGYGKAQIQDLEETINRAECELVVFATPIHLAHLITIHNASIRVRYAYKDHNAPLLQSLLEQWLCKIEKRIGTS